MPNSNQINRNTANTSSSQRVTFIAPNELADAIKSKKKFSAWLRMAAIERLERERLERERDASKQTESE